MGGRALAKRNRGPSCMRIVKDRRTGERRFESPQRITHFLRKTCAEIKNERFRSDTDAMKFRPSTFYRCQ
jgi:hypothetical protein